MKVHEIDIRYRETIQHYCLILYSVLHVAIELDH